jgi:hypothetical protein
VCGVVVEEASREVEVTGSNHGNRGASLTGTGGWLASGVSPIKKVFFLFIFGFYVLTRKTSVLAGDLSARQH